MKPRPAAPFPESVGAYELILPIASGGMGTVYLARKRGAGGFEREVALKLTHAFLREQPEFAAQLVEEAKIASRIVHPNVVQVLDVEDDPYGVFLVMQYVEGDTLAGLMQHAWSSGRLVPSDIAMRVLSDALTGLHAAHELKDGTGRSLGIVHRDFTPQNILVGTDGTSRLTDFGVAKAATRSTATRTGVVKGKTAYMSPEQVRAQPLDRRCDVWSAGVIAWELFAGRRLREATEDPTALLLRIATEQVPRLSTVRPDIPPAVDEAVAWALAHDRQRRCPTAEQLRDRLVMAWGDRAGPATAAEVAEHVNMVAGAALAERRNRVRTHSPDARGNDKGTSHEELSLSEDVSGLAELSQPFRAGTEASLVSSARHRVVRPRRRTWVLAVEAVIVGAALVVLAVGTRRLVAPVAALPSSSAFVASTGPEPQAAPPPVTTEEPAPPPTSSAAASDTLDVVPAASATSRPPTTPARRATTRSRPKEVSSNEPPLAKSPYE